MISVLILTKNEEKMIRTCLESVKELANEIIVLDSESDDQTVTIAKEYTDQIFIKEFAGFANTRNFLAEKAKGEWLLYLDADERVSTQLREELLYAIRHKSHTAYAIPRRNVLLGKWQKHGGWWPDYQIRLFKKTQLKTWQGELHEQPVFEGNLGYLKNPLLHLTHRDIISMMTKTAQWAPIEAKLRLEAGHPPLSWWRFIKIVKVELLSRFLKGGWRDGVEGVIEIFYQTFSLFITYVRLWEMQRKENLEDTYKKFDENLLKNKFNL